MKLNDFVEKVNNFYAKEFIMIERVEMNLKDYQELCDDLFANYYTDHSTSAFKLAPDVKISRPPSFKMTFTFNQIEIVENKELLEYIHYFYKRDGLEEVMYEDL